MHLIGNEAGFLPKAYDLLDSTNLAWGQLPLGPAERADIILDLTNTPPGRYRLDNSAPEILFAGSAGWEITRQAAGDDETTNRIMELRVGRATRPDPSTPARRLKLPDIAGLPSSTDTVRIALDMTHNHEPAQGVPTQVATTYLSQIVGDPQVGPVKVVPKMWADPVWINPQVGQTIDLEIYNWSVVPHPFHVHEVSYQVIGRNKITYTKGSGELTIGDAITIAAADTGRKDTVVVNPGEMARLRATFSYPGRFVAHCHNLEHEDNEMMVPFRVGPAPAGEPQPIGHDMAGATMAHDQAPSANPGDRLRATLTSPVAITATAAAAAVTVGGFYASSRASRNDAADISAELPDGDPT